MTHISSTHISSGLRDRLEIYARILMPTFAVATTLSTLALAILTLH